MIAGASDKLLPKPESTMAIRAHGGLSGERRELQNYLRLNYLDTKRLQRMNKLFWSFGVGNKSVDLFNGADS
jgi:hypothetical protein